MPRPFTFTDKGANHTEVEALKAIPGDSGRFFYHTGRYYLVVVDCYSDWPTVVPMGKDITATNMIAGLTELLSRTAVPNVLCKGHSSHQDNSIIYPAVGISPPNLYSTLS